MLIQVYSCLAQFTYVYHCLLVFTYTYHWLLVHVYLRLPMFNRVDCGYISLPMFTPVYSSLPMFTRV